MKLQKNFTAVLLCAAMLASVGLSGCNNKSEPQKDQSSVQESQQSSVQESQQSSVQESGESQQSDIQESSEAAESSAAGESEESSSEQSSTEESSQASAEESSKEESKPVSDKEIAEAAIADFRAGKISEKQMYENIYSLDKYKNNTGGHVITDVDGDGAYELVTRASDMKSITIYDVEDDNTISPVGFVSTEKTNLIYLFGDGLTKCYFETLEKLSDNQTKVKISSYGGKNNVKEEAVFIVEDNGLLNYRIFDGSGNELKYTSFSDDNVKFITNTWQESFNDNFYEAMPETKTKEVCETSEYGYLIFKEGISLESFAQNYYLEDDKPLWSVENMVHGLHYKNIQQLDVNEIVGRYNYKFSDPLTIAFMNKNPGYDADASVTLDDIFAKFNQYEKYNYDYMNRLQGGQI